MDASTNFRSGAPDAVRELLAPSAEGLTPPERADVVLWALHLYLRAGKHAPDMRPLGERYDQDRPAYVISSARITYGAELTARTKALELRQLAGVGPQSDSRVTMLMASAGIILLETVTFGPTQKEWRAGEPHYRRHALWGEIRPMSRVELVQYLTEQPGLMNDLVGILRSGTGHEVKRRQQRLETAQYIDGQMNRLWERIGHNQHPAQ